MNAKTELKAALKKCGKTVTDVEHVWLGRRGQEGSFTPAINPLTGLDLDAFNFVYNETGVWMHLWGTIKFKGGSYLERVKKDSHTADNYPEHWEFCEKYHQLLPNTIYPGGN